MKPRTKFQREVMRTHSCLPEMNQHFHNWATNESAEHIAFYTKNKIFCLDCGENFDKPKRINKTVTCPHCKTKLQPQESLKRLHVQDYYVCVAQLFHGYQIIRYFNVMIHHSRGFKKRVVLTETLQHFFEFDHEQFKREVVARLHNWSYYYSSWSNDMQIREKNNDQKYDILHRDCYPGSEFNDVFKKYGIDHNLKSITYLEAINKVPNSNRMETLVKAKQYDLVRYMNTNNWRIHESWDSIKIFIRNNFIVKDVNLVMDYLELLKWFKKDVRSPKYLFPLDMKKEHDKLVLKKRNIQRKQEIEQRIRKMQIEEERYIRDYGRFLEFYATDGLIEIKVVQSVKECMEIGDKLVHCVYTNEYYKKPQTLILNATIKGKPIETIEVSLDNFEIRQCQGLRNELSKFHHKIMSLMTKNLGQIQQIEQSMLAKAC